MSNDLLTTINSYIEDNGGNLYLANWLILENEKYFFKGSENLKAKQFLSKRGIYDIDSFNSYCEAKKTRNNRVSKNKLKRRVKRSRLRKIWTQEDVDSLFNLRLVKDYSWPLIATTLRRTKSSCYNKFYQESEQMGIILTKGMF